MWQTRSHLINGSRWRGGSFWPDARRDAGRVPASPVSLPSAISHLRCPNFCFLLSQFLLFPVPSFAASVPFLPIRSVAVTFDLGLHAAAGICGLASDVSAGTVVSRVVGVCGLLGQFSSVVEQRFCKPSVVGSIPTTGSSPPSHARRTRPGSLLDSRSISAALSTSSVSMRAPSTSRKS